MERLRLTSRVFLALIAFPTLIYAASPITWHPARILGMIYPEQAASARIQGLVEAKCLIKDDGSVSDVIILSGHPVLTPSVRTNLLDWTFRRIADGGAMEALVKFEFQIKGECDEYNRCKDEFWVEYPDKIIVRSGQRQIHINRSYK
jgi:hypothetical protein